MSIFMDSNNCISSDFNSEAYLEYRSRVFEQLASEHNKENQKEAIVDELISDQQLYNLDFVAHAASSSGNSLKNWYDAQPAWDDSDLQAETYTFSPNVNGSRVEWKNSQTNNIISTNKQSANTNYANTTQSLSLRNQSVSDAYLKNFSQPMVPNNSTESKVACSETSPSKSLCSTLHIQEQKLEREAVRCKLAFEGDSLHDNVPDQSWLSDRSFSAASQSLHLCYINDSCSSDESDIELPTSNHNSSIITTSDRERGNKETDQCFRVPATTSYTRDASPTCNENGGSSICKTMRANLELEARFQLAQAQQKAKILAEADKQIEKLQRRVSLAQRLVSDSLPEDTASKLKSYSLTRRDCSHMSVGQLQLILNDMHAKKQALNEQLMRELLKRDELQTEQDAKLTDIEDTKAMLNALGPETTV